MPEPPHEYFYEAVEWTDPEPLRTDMSIEFDNGDGFEAGTFEIVASGLTEIQADEFLAKVNSVSVKQ